MTRKKNVSEIVLYTFIGIVVAFWAIFWLIIGIYPNFAPNPPEPETKYGEFPFEIVYEIDGEVFTINDTYVCEFKGFEPSGGGGKCREWKGYLKSTGKKTYRCNLVSEENRVVDVFIGSSEYYMSDPEYHEHYPYLFGSDPKNDQSDTHDEDEIMEKFNVRIISSKLSEPIENTYK